MFDEDESIPKDVAEIREMILDALKAMNIEPEPLRKILADIGLGEPLMSGLPECPDVSKEFMMAFGVSVFMEHDWKRFFATLKLTVKFFKGKEEAQQFKDFIDALFSKYSIKFDD